MSPRPHPLDYAVIKRFVRCSIRQPCSLGRLSCWGPCDAIDTITHDTYAPPGWGRPTDGATPTHTHTHGTRPIGMHY